MCDTLTVFGVLMKLVLFIQITCGVAWMGKHLCDTFPMRDVLKQILTAITL